MMLTKDRDGMFQRKNQKEEKIWEMGIGASPNHGFTVYACHIR